ncbi:alpha/beta hydrolase [Neptunitalea chrysea]|uniref:Alpha/beta hydrolase n=1 Tax=Neptunitalea chrysea TaxID=1647581 RepID=A0A9W6B857_9FLAO|nr:alpha/beta fold hydrolase [Neptunitalea chrysea]GLB53232.1 alpha/beta hydrolase [Neptunitalea chrysea]
MMNKYILTFLTIFCSYQVFSQNITTEEINLENGKIKLPGTLTYPKSDKKMPLTIYIHGSGNVDRNGNQKAAMPVSPSYIQQLADSLNKKGIAFYRYDKRSATQENIPILMKGIVFDELVDDAVIAVNNFKEDTRFDNIILIGHSQGSLVAMLTAQQTKVAKYISLAGPGDPISKTLISQIEKQSPPLAEKTATYFKELEETDTIASVDPLLLSIFAPQNQKFFKNWNHYTPSEEIKKLTIPILIIQGNADLQVTVKDATTLKDAYPNAVLEIIPDMNHVLKEVKNTTENQQSYYSPDFPLSSKLVSIISTFIKQ